MTRLTIGRIALLGFCVSQLAGALPAGPADAQPGYGISMPDALQPTANVAAFASKEEAKAFLAHYLPIATAGNPRYRSDKAGVAMAWITKAITFATPADSNGILVSMSEDVLEFHNGVRAATGTHEAAFSIGDVKISERKESGDLTEAGEPAVGIIFNCHSGKCIRSAYDGHPSLTDWTDISIQDAALRGRILAAFETLQRPGGD